MWDPKEKSFIYIPEEEVPLFGLPRMGEVGRNLMNCAVWLAFLGGAGAVTLYRSKKEREEDGKEHGPSEGLH